MPWQQSGRRGDAPSPVGTLVYMLIGPILWAVQLIAIYGSHVLICTQDAPHGLAQPAVYSITAAMAAVLLAVLLLQPRFARLLGLGPKADGRQTYDRIARVTGILSGIAILWSGATALVLSACIQGR